MNPHLLALALLVLAMSGLLTLIGWSLGFVRPAVPVALFSVLSAGVLVASTGFAGGCA